MGINKSLSDQFFNTLTSRNLYSPTNVYSIDQNKLTGTIDKIVSFLSNDTVSYNNSLTATLLEGGNDLSRIGNEELAKAFAKRVSSTIRTQNLPSVSTNGVLNININKPLSYWSITPNAEANTMSGLLKSMTGYSSVSNPVPIGNNEAWLDKNTGEGQRMAYESNVSTNKFVKDKNEYGGKVDSLKKNIIPDSIVKGTDTDSIKHKTELFINSTDGVNMHPSTVIFKRLQDDGTTKVIPKGNGVLADDGKTYLRTFNSTKKYEATSDLMKFKHGTAGGNSTLQTVFPKIFPSAKDDYKNLMFSITNLAQNAKETMWFVPYNLTLSEDISVSWNKFNFIGRNEPMYAYNGTERSCTLSFTLIADYPAELNNLSKWGNASSNDYNKFFSRDNDIVNYNKLNAQEVAKKNLALTQASAPVPISPVSNPFGSSNPLKYYFDNNDFSMKSSLSNDNVLQTGQKAIGDFNSKIDELIAFMNSKEGETFRLVIEGRTSNLYTTQYNKLLAYKRANSLYKFISGKISGAENYGLTEFTEPLSSAKSPTSTNLINRKFKIKASGEKSAATDSSADTINRDVVDRFAVVYLEQNPELMTVTNPKIEDDTKKTMTSQDNTTSKNSVGDFYFEKHKAGDKLVTFNEEEIAKNLMNTYGNNIKYFSPVFHSQTPVDLNKRVTFLQQCTRQGNSVAGGGKNGSTDSDLNGGNSIFGRPPVCELRLGDFLNTKILIQNISLEYEPLIWDTNPEGIGMQPMLCNVYMSCIILGGSSLQGPVNELQNALTSNYYANAESTIKK